MLSFLRIRQQMRKNFYLTFTIIDAMLSHSGICAFFAPKFEQAHAFSIASGATLNLVSWPPTARMPQISLAIKPRSGLPRPAHRLLHRQRTIQKFESSERSSTADAKALKSQRDLDPRPQRL
jgi:hypothetical protein